jgi:hypothetical protein
MRQLLLFLVLVIILSGTALGNGTNEPAKEADQAIEHDCRVTAELSVILLKTRAKSTPDKLIESAVKYLSSKGYKGSFGDAEFVARLYTGMTLQMENEIDKVMEEMTTEDLRLMELDHEMACLRKEIK